jgi:hypothetical protein
VQKELSDFVASELERAISDYVRRQNKQYLPQMCKAAEAWHKGDQSMMRVFVNNAGHLDKSSDYKALAAEARVALRELEMQKSRSREIWEPSLARLHDLAYHTDQAVKELRILARVAASVTQSGIREQYVRGIVARAVKYVLDNRP